MFDPPDMLEAAATFSWVWGTMEADRRVADAGVEEGDGVCRSFMMFACFPCFQSLPDQAAFYMSSYDSKRGYALRQIIF